MAPEKKNAGRYTGYLLLVLLFLGWFEYHWSPGVLAVLSVALILYGLLAAPVPCSAKIRNGGRCRLNGKGLLRGCHYEQHKWQHVKMLIDRECWGEYRRSVFRSISGNAAALSAIAGLGSFGASVVMPLVTKVLS